MCPSAQAIQVCALSVSGGHFFPPVFEAQIHLELESLLMWTGQALPSSERNASQGLSCHFLNLGTFKVKSEGINLLRKQTWISPVTT